jgi:D-glycero-D-manno-heptose 1,7-bisphosphate phosphatase
MRPAVFVDRDGTLIEDAGHCTHPEQVKILPGVPEALRRVRDAGFAVIIITNQSGIGRQIFTEEQYSLVHAETLRQIGPALINATYYSTDTPEMDMGRRKPSPVMLLEAAEEHGISLQDSYMIGDRAGDVEAGQRAGVKTIFVESGFGMGDSDIQPDYTAAHVVEAIDWILAHA